MTSILAAEGGYQEFVLNGGEWAILGLSGALRPARPRASASS